MGLFLDVLSVFFAVGMGWMGFQHGIVEELGRLVGLFLSLIVAFSFYLDIAGFILHFITLDPWWAILFGYVFLFSLTMFFVRFLTYLLHYLVVSGSTQWINCGMGFLFGVIKGGFLVGLFIWLVDISPMKSWSNILHQQSRFARYTTTTRERMISFFGWTDPVRSGEQYVKNLLEYGITTGDQE